MVAKIFFPFEETFYDSNIYVKIILNTFVRKVI
jgi:hypothetical protein